MIVGFLQAMGLPADNVIAGQDERRILGDNIESLIRDLPVEVRKDARYLSVIGAGFGLFDYSLNAVWNEVVINLRRGLRPRGIFSTRLSAAARLASTTRPKMSLRL
ncbi:MULTISPECIES: hypothetical protein [Bradyrhizobium]|uniref:hypothetical protein n=1 Tax=Bradyrhizobium TaxID=374 RepID=UPI0004B600BE|nr:MULTISPECIES: hypothetical protein [Bradyrhizobium]